MGERYVREDGMYDLWGNVFESLGESVEAARKRGGNEVRWRRGKAVEVGGERIGGGLGGGLGGGGHYSNVKRN